MESCNAKTGEVKRRVSALQDLASILELTGIDSDVVLPVNADTEGQVVLPVSDGQIDLVLKMVLPDFLHEILHRLDTILAKDTASAAGRRSNLTPDDMTELIEIKKSIDQIKDSTGTIDNLPQETLDRVHLLETLHTDPIDNPPEKFTDTPPSAMVKIKPKRPPPPRRQSTLESSHSKNSSFQDSTESGDGYQPTWEPLTINSPAKDRYDFLDSDDIASNTEPSDTEFQPYFLGSDKIMDDNHKTAKGDESLDERKPARPPLPFKVSSFQTKEEKAITSTESEDSLEVDIDELMQQSSPFWKPTDSMIKPSNENKVLTHFPDTVTHDEDVNNSSQETPNEEQHEENPDAKSWFDRRFDSSYRDPFGSTDPFSTFEDKDIYDKDGYPYYEKLGESRQSSTDSHYSLEDEPELPATERNLETLPSHTHAIVLPQLDNSTSDDSIVEPRQQREAVRGFECVSTDKPENISQDNYAKPKDTKTNINPNIQIIKESDQAGDDKNSINLSLAVSPEDNAKERGESIPDDGHQSNAFKDAYQFPKLDVERKDIEKYKTFDTHRADDSYCSSDSLNTIDENEELVVMKPRKFQPVEVQSEPVEVQSEENHATHAAIKKDDHERFLSEHETLSMDEASQLKKEPFAGQEQQEQLNTEEESKSLPNDESSLQHIDVQADTSSPQHYEDPISEPSGVTQHGYETRASVKQPQSSQDMASVDHPPNNGTADEARPTDDTGSLHSNESMPPIKPPRTARMKKLDEIRTNPKPSRPPAPQPQPVYTPDKAQESNPKPPKPPRPPIPTATPRQNSDVTPNHDTSSKLSLKPVRPPPPTPPLTPRTSPKPVRPPRPKSMTSLLSEDAEIFHRDKNENPRRTPPPRPPLSKSHSDLSSVGVGMSKTPPLSPKPRRPPPPKGKETTKSNDILAAKMAAPGKIPKLEIPDNINNLESEQIEDLSESEQAKSPKSPNLTRQSHVSIPEEPLPEVGYMVIDPKALNVISVRKVDKSDIDHQDLELIGTGQTPDGSEFLVEHTLSPLEDIKIDAIGNLIDLSPVKEGDRRVMGKFHSVDTYENTESHLTSSLQQFGWLNLEQNPQFQENPNIIVTKPEEVDMAEEASQKCDRPIDNLATNLANGIVKSSVGEMLNNANSERTEDNEKNSAEGQPQSLEGQENAAPDKEAGQFSHSNDRKELGLFEESAQYDKEEEEATGGSKNFGNPENDASLKPTRPPLPQMHVHHVDQPISHKNRPTRPSSLPQAFEPNALQNELPRKKIEGSCEPKPEINQTITDWPQEDIHSKQITGICDDLQEKCSINAADVTSRPKNKASNINSNFSWQHRGMTIAVNTSFRDSSERTRPDRDLNMQISVSYAICEGDTVTRDGSFNVQVDLPTAATLAFKEEKNSTEP